MSEKVAFELTPADREEVMMSLGIARDHWHRSHDLATLDEASAEYIAYCKERIRQNRRILEELRRSCQ